MSATFKGRADVILVSEEPAYDAETGVRQFESLWAGSKAAIFGFAENLEADGISYRISNNGPVYQLAARVPQNEPTVVEELDRYEISTESADKIIFEFPTVIFDAGDYDANLTDGELPYRKVCEKSLEEETAITTSNFNTDPGAQLITMLSVIRHLKNGVTGFQVDSILLRRYRKIDITYAYAAGKFSLAEGSLIYTTGQLGLPTNVAFSLPTAPADPSSDYRWGWKRRGQRVDIVGNYAEQTVELLFAPWSNLLYADAVGALNWGR